MRPPQYLSDMGDEGVAAMGDELVPVVVAVRMKPNTENAPIAFQADPTNNTVAMLQPNHGDAYAEVDGESHLRQQFSYDYVFSESSSQEAVYKKTVEQFVDLVLDGYDLTVAAYGQSGSGKTHTLLGSDLPFAMNEADFGLVARVVRDLFHRSNSRIESFCGRFEVRASYFDVDDEKIFDLLSCRVVLPLPGPEEEILYGRAYTAALGLSEIECNTIDDVMRCLEKGLHLHDERRSLDNGMAVAFLDHHTIFQLDVRVIEEVEGVRRIKESTVRFVDFVGSDKLLSGGNRGLLSLDLVVSALGNPQRNAMDKVSFQDSPVTRILRDSIAGTAMCVVLCCVSPLATDIQETNRSLEFGRRANKISNDPKPRITLIPLSRNDMDDDEDISQVRSASVTRGNLPPLSPPSNDVDGSCSNNNDAESSISISTFSQHMELHQEQQAQLLAQHLHQIAPPPPPGVDPILYNLHLIQYSGLLNVAMPTAPVAQPIQIENGFDNREVYYNSPPATHQHQGQMSPQRSSPTLSPLSQRSPLSANVYWQSTPVQIQRTPQLLPPPPTASIPPPPPLLDPATAPINLDADEIERRGSEEGQTVKRSEGDAAAAKNWRTPKMPSILEVSESGSVTNSSTSTTTGANANTIAKSLEAREVENADHDEDGDTTSETEVDSEEFDSECSDFSEVEGIDTEVVDTSSQVMCLIAQFVAATDDIVRESELEWQVKWTRSKSMGERLAALHIQPENLLPSARPEEEEGMLKELRKAQDTIKTLESREGQLIERLSLIASREEMLKKEAEHTEKLKASLEEHIKENEVTAFSELTMKKDCERLRRYKYKRSKEREGLEKEHQNLKQALYQKPDDEDVVASYILAGSKIAQLDELFNTVDLAIEFKNEKLTGKALDYLRYNSSEGDSDHEDNDLTRVLKRLSTEECRALIHRLQLRVINLSSGLVTKEVENLQLNYKLEETSRKYRKLSDDLLRKEHDHNQSRRNQRREHEKKVQLLSKQVEDRERRIQDLEETNKLLTKFYRDNKDRRPRCGDSAAAGAAAEGSRSKRSAREREHHRNPDLIELAATDSPSAASSSAAAVSRRGKPSVTIRDQKLIIEDKKKRPTTRVPGVQRPSM